MNRVRLLIGAVGILLAVFLWSGNRVTASAFTETWRSTYYRVVAVHSSSKNQTSGNLCLGPASWQVDGTFDTGSFTETWRVGNFTDINDESGWITSGVLTNPVLTTNYGFSADCVDNESNNTYFIDMNPTGLYGGFVTGNDGWIDSWNLSEDFLGLRSMPQKWTIHGTVTL